MNSTCRRRACLFLISLQLLTTTTPALGEVFVCALSSNTTAEAGQKPHGPETMTRLDKEQLQQQHQESQQPADVCTFNDVYIEPNMVVDFVADSTTTHAVKTIRFENSTVAMDIDELLDRLCYKFWNLVYVVVGGNQLECHVPHHESSLALQPDTTVEPVLSAAIQHKVKVIHFDVDDQDPVHDKLNIMMWGIATILLLIGLLAVGGVVALVKHRRQQRENEFLWRSFRYGL